MIPSKPLPSYWTNFAKDGLLALNIFVAFLLFFENRFTVPVWLQPLGRMHPLLLHFPIVMLIIGMFLEFFRFSSNNSKQQLYQAFTSNMLFFGVALSGVTATMGLFLSKEEGYDPDALWRHKWSGVILFFAGSLIFIVRNSAWYSSAIARSGSILTVVFIIAAGHYGAALTHGDNYILAPLTIDNEVENVVLEDARVFDHMVKPILQKKCVSCHNTEKVKGELLLTDEKAILKGGKSGNFIVAGNPEMSLLLQRIHLPETDKKHMPPKGKEQLTEQETEILRLWIKENAHFKRKVMEYPVDDSLRLIAAEKFMPAKSLEEVYDFEVADPDLVKKLNNDNRVIDELSRGSAALAVSFYNTSAYNSKMLSDLLVLKNNVVDISLSKMPVKDADLKILAQFTQLRKLNLNFTDITQHGLGELVQLIKLKHLAVSGTSLTLTALKNILPQFKSLQQIAAWNCGLSDTDIDQLKKANAGLTILSGFHDDGSNPMTLNSPALRNISNTFADSMMVVLSHPIRETQISYTMDGSVPDSASSPIFTNPIPITSDAVIRTRAFKKGWLGSDAVTINLYKSAYKPDTAEVIAGLFRQHFRREAKTLFDGLLGPLPINENVGVQLDEKWIGFSPEKMELVLKFNEPKTIRSVSLHVMVRERLDIYPPAFVEIWAGENADEMKLVGKSLGKMPGKGSTLMAETIVTGFNPVKASSIKIVAMPAVKMVSGDVKKNRFPLLVIDEILIN